MRAANQHNAQVTHNARRQCSKVILDFACVFKVHNAMLLPECHWINGSICFRTRHSSLCLCVKKLELGQFHCVRLRARGCFHVGLPPSFHFSVSLESQGPFSSPSACRPRWLAQKFQHGLVPYSTRIVNENTKTATVQGPPVRKLSQFQQKQHQQQWSAPMQRCGVQQDVGFFPGHGSSSSRTVHERPS